MLFGSNTLWKLLTGWTKSQTGNIVDIYFSQPVYFLIVFSIQSLRLLGGNKCSNEKEIRNQPVIAAPISGTCFSMISLQRSCCLQLMPQMGHKVRKRVPKHKGSRSKQYEPTISEFYVTQCDSSRTSRPSDKTKAIISSQVNCLQKSSTMQH